MKKRFVFLSSILFFYIVSSEAQEIINQGPQPTKVKTVYKGVTDLSCGLEINFGSYGAGIDGKAFDRVMNVIQTNKLTTTSKNIGREGETRICLLLNELKGSKRKNIINQLKKIAKEGALVSLSIQ